MKMKNQSKSRCSFLGTNMQIDMTYVRFYRSHFGSLDTLYMKGDDKGEFVIMPQYEHSPNTFILATDYETYALEYSCEVSMLFGPIEMANIMCKSTFYHEIVSSFPEMPFA